MTSSPGAVLPGTDSLPTNLSVASMEQEAWIRRRGGNAQDITAVIQHFCMHHQAALAKKPLLLRFPGVTTGISPYIGILQTDCLSLSLSRTYSKF